MHTKPSFRLSFLSLCCLAAFSSNTIAECSVDLSADGAVVCSGVDSDGVSVTQDDTTVIVEQNANVQGNPAIEFLNGGGFLSNAGSIDADGIGVSFSDVGGDLFNIGTISGQNAFAIYSNGFSDINNDGGTITSSGVGQIGVFLDNNGVVRNQNNGLISAYQGVVLGNGGQIFNTANIEGSSIGALTYNGGEIHNSSSTGSIFGTDVGVQTEGSTFINNLGSISSAQIGVQMNGGGLISNGQDSSIEGENGAGIVIQSNPAIVDNRGSIYGLQDGIFGLSNVTINNEQTGSITAGNVHAVNLIEVSTVNNAGNIEGEFSGVSLEQGGLVDNRSTGVIKGRIGAAVFSGVGGDILNSGLIEGDTGVELGNAGIIQNFESGVIKGNAFSGVRMANNGELFNEGHVEGQQTGVVVVNGGEVYNTGNIIGTDGDGVVTFGATNVNNDGGSINGRFVGLNLNDGGIAINQNGGLIEGDRAVVVFNGGTLYNSAQIQGESTGVDLNLNANLFNEATGIINSNALGVISNGNSSIDNLGSISGNIGAIYTSGGQIYNGFEASIESSNGAAIVIDDFFGSVVNEGTISASSDGVFSSTNAFVINGETGSITAGGAGLNLQASSTVYNAGQINGEWSGVYLQEGGTVENSESGSIIAQFNTVNTRSTDSVIINEGLIKAEQGIGVSMQQGGSITNSGMIVGGAGDNPANSSDAVSSFNLFGQTIDPNETQFTLVNTADASIIGHRNGITSSGLNNSITNNGMIQGRDGGVFMQSTGNEEDGLILQGNVVNTGEISATGNGPLVNSGFLSEEQVGGVTVRRYMQADITNSGIISSVGSGIRSEGQVDLVNTQSGVITGDSNNNGSGLAITFARETTENFNPEAVAQGDYNDTVLNQGTINGDVQLGAGNDSFVQSGQTAVTNGNIDGGSGFDTVEYNLGEQETGTLNGSQLSNFERLEKTGAGFLTFEGNAELEEVLVQQGVLSLAENSVLNLVANPNNANSGQLIVADGAILSGGGTVNGDVNVQNGGIVNPGFSPGTLFINGDLNLNDGGVLQIELQELADGTIAIDNYNISGGFSVTGGSVEFLFDLLDNTSTTVSDVLGEFDFGDFFDFADNSFIDDFTNELIASASFFASSDSGMSSSLITFNNGADLSDITISEVSAPAIFSMMGLSGLFLLLRSRKFSK